MLPIGRVDVDGKGEKFRLFRSEVESFGLWIVTKSILRGFYTCNSIGGGVIGWVRWVIWI